MVDVLQAIFMSLISSSVSVIRQRRTASPQWKLHSFDYNHNNHCMRMKSSNSRAEVRLIVLCARRAYCPGSGWQPWSPWRTKDLWRTKELNLWWSMTHVASVHLLKALRAELRWCEPGWFAPPVAQLVLAGRARGAPLIYCSVFLWGWLTECRRCVWVCEWSVLLTVCVCVCVREGSFVLSCRSFRVCRCVGVCHLISVN